MQSPPPPMDVDQVDSFQDNKRGSAEFPTNAILGALAGTAHQRTSAVQKIGSLTGKSGNVGRSMTANTGGSSRNLNESRTRLSQEGNINGAEVKEKAMKSTFVDANAMKEKVRQNLTKPQHSVKDYYKPNSVFTKMATSSIFEYSTLGVIGFNALWIAIDTDFNDSEILLNAHPVFIVAENLFCIYFFFEWFVRYMSFQRKRDGLKDAWFVFDSFMVFMMVLETWVMTLVLLIVGGASGGAGDASILRVARLLRLSRMARMARLLRALPELMIMIRGMVAATRSVFFTLCLLIIVMYVFGIAFTQLCADTDVGDKFFPNVPRSMFTLLIYGTLLDNIGALARELGALQIYIAAIFFLFVLLAALTVMNMLIGVLCEVVNAVAATEKEEMLVTYVNQKLHRVVHLLDADGGGTISKKEFMQILENSDAVRCLQDVGVDVIGLVDFAEYIFEDDSSLEADDAEDVELDFGKFMEVVLQLRGTNNATVKDIVDLRKFMRHAMLETNRQLQRLCQDNEVLRRKLGCPQGLSVIYPDQMRLLEHMQEHMQSSASIHTLKGDKVEHPRTDKSHALCEAKTQTSSPRSSASHHIARESETLALTNNQTEELRGMPKQILWPSRTWSPDAVEACSPPLPLQPSPSVHFLQPPFDETTGVAVEPPDLDKDGLNLRSCTPDIRLGGQWYPYSPVSVQVINNVNAPTSPSEPVLSSHARAGHSGSGPRTGTAEATMVVPLVHEVNVLASQVHGFSNAHAL